MRTEGNKKVFDSCEIRTHAGCPNNLAGYRLNHSAKLSHIITHWHNATKILNLKRLHPSVYCAYNTHNTQYIYIPSTTYTIHTLHIPSRTYEVHAITHTSLITKLSTYTHMYPLQANQTPISCFIFLHIPCTIKSIAYTYKKMRFIQTTTHICVLTNRNV